MNYSVNVGGKRLRPMLMEEVFFAFGGEGDVVEPFMAALEMIHTYSLVHDDLPAMDNDMLRRGKPTTHMVYGEAMGVLCGDALLNYAFETALLSFEKTSDTETLSKRIPAALSVLAKKAGIYGMIGGQVCDVEAEKKGLSLSEEQLSFIIDNKTGALIESAMMIGGILAGASESEIKDLEIIAKSVGKAFQIQDDILDVTSDTETLGKPVGSDIENHKSTYVSLLGIEKARAYEEQLFQSCLEKVYGLTFNHGLMIEMINKVMKRVN
jgi:geranylgeranyl diphosphate synthase type II